MGAAAVFVVAILAVASPAAAAAGAERGGLVTIPPGLYTPFQRVKAANSGETEAQAPEAIAAFAMDRAPVTNAEYLGFVTAHPEWRKSWTKTLFADGRYLGRWPADLDFGHAEAGDRPVTDVSWFAARAYCKTRGLDLPTTAQWEYALADAGRDEARVRARSLEWFSRPNGAGPGAIGGPVNGYGVGNLIGLVWEWTEDFNAYAITAESRDPNGNDSAAVCGGAAAGIADASDYPAFMRASMRASLKANYTADMLGFRCAGGAP
ncbi:formylglycine-generating enzyme required for sulfatase activity [Roseiarcus fermentans]|uniref:Formylglycine-generating enzyme required for sulfatase activity n=1 Tax=Roseiarcus fermentans TaxID=1473586 RepID=A0A366F9W0_9HYPH|nr:formylglycine-generating enzyme family protein [Roseiarcus fermentans]RBP10549.1 formylglycine-generating enzyme required for sulfatase activity [Roseiarcus fermentans]